jgi:hypothetical protein
MKVTEPLRPENLDSVQALGAKQRLMVINDTLNHLNESRGLQRVRYREYINYVLTCATCGVTGVLMSLIVCRIWSYNP